MERTSSTSINVARAYLAALFAVNAFRAAMLSITPPEAYTYNRFVGPPLREALAQYDANNHVLYTLLARISTSFFHLTELSLRLPSLLAGALYLWAVYRLARRAFGEGGMFLAAVGLLTLNPMVLDYMIAARGYGMALAFWMWGLELLLECLESFSRGKLKLAAVCLGLSVSASLAFVVPAVALAAVFAFAARRLIPTVDRWHLPLYFLITAFLFLAIPLNRAEAGTFTISRLRNGATLYFIPLTTLAALALVYGLQRRPVKVAFLILSALCCAWYLSEFDVSAYREWPAYADSRSMAKALRADADRRRVRIGASPQVEPVLNYFRDRYGQGNWGVEPLPFSGPLDYYALSQQDAGLVRQRNLRVIYRDGGLVLAR